MLSDEEKEELDNIKESPTYREVILLRAIEKQSKEIEELKAINQMQKYRIEVIDERELISKDKIKSKNRRNKREVRI